MKQAKKKLKRKENKKKFLGGEICHERKDFIGQTTNRKFQSGKIKTNNHETSKKTADNYKK